MPAILAKKLGMTQRFTDDGSVERVTVLEAGPCPVTAIRTQDVDGYVAVQLAFGSVREKALSKPELGHLKKAGAPPMRTVREFRDAADEWQIGDTVTVEAFQVGQDVKVAGIGKGKGVFPGVRGPGRMGGKRVTQKGLRIVELIPAQNLMLVRGSVPGPKGGTVEVRTDA
jgi:large subunit ribosomal protein L3